MFVSDSVDAKGHYPQSMTYDGYVIAEFSGKDGDPWQVRGNELALMETFEGYEDLDGDEKEIVGQNTFAPELGNLPHDNPYVEDSRGRLIDFWQNNKCIICNTWFQKK